MNNVVTNLIETYTKNEQDLIMVNTQISEQVAALVDARGKLEEANSTMRKQILEAMEKYNVKEYENEFVKFTYVAPQTRKGIDTTKLKAVYPDIAQELETITNVKASIRIKVKEK